MALHSSSNGRSYRSVAAFTAPKQTRREVAAAITIAAEGQPQVVQLVEAVAPRGLGML